MFGEVSCDCHLAAIQCRVAEAVDSLIGVDLQRDEIPAWRRNQYFCIRDLHRSSSILSAFLSDLAICCRAWQKLARIRSDSPNQTLIRSFCIPHQEQHENHPDKRNHARNDHERVEQM